MSQRATGSRRKQELNNCVLALSTLVNELVSIGKIEDDLQEANLALEEWRKKFGDLQQEKESLLKEMTEAKEKKDAEIDSVNRELSEYIQQMADLSKNSKLNYGKTIKQLSEGQRLRIIKELKGRADLALWFLKSHGLKLTYLHVREAHSRRERTFDFLKEKVTQEDEDNLEQILFLLDKFGVSDELYHELTII